MAKNMGLIILEVFTCSPRLFKKNPRLNILVSTFDKMNSEKTESLFENGRNIFGEHLAKSDPADNVRLRLRTIFRIYCYIYNTE